MWDLPIFHPRLHVAAVGGMLFVGAGQHLHGYDSSGERIWTATLPRPETPTVFITPTDLPTRQERLSRLGLAGTEGVEQVQTGYLRLTRDTVFESGWLKTEVSDLEKRRKSRRVAQLQLRSATGFRSLPDSASYVRSEVGP